MKRLGRTLVADLTAKEAAFTARIVGADHADYSGNCQKPVPVELTGHKGELLDRLKRWRESNADYGLIDGKAYWSGGVAGTPTVRHVDLKVRCRKCEPCLEVRRNHWIARAKTELGSAPRTWFGTLTLRPEHQFRISAQARSRLHKGGTIFKDLSADEQFAETSRELVREIQLYWKRLRKAGCKFRYLAVIERHKSGAPHVHYLLHELAEPVRHKALSTCWTLGFSNIKLVAEHENSKAAYYVAKYLTKASRRMLSSARYGRTDTRHSCLPNPNNKKRATF